MRTDVQSRAAHGGGDEPWRFSVGSAQVDVAEVVDRWSSAHHRHFKVKVKKGEGSEFCVLRHDNATHHWEMTALTRHR